MTYGWFHLWRYGPRPVGSFSKYSNTEDSAPADAPSKIDLQEHEQRERARQVPAPTVEVDHNEYLERAQREAQRAAAERNAPGLEL
ncbi:hypothetical protein [Nocardiopsis metallicus]|uniref:Uncharacterized protein n=1 Tax=Nocardiopsis metallicus TaxID=179819 RepID=A0A840WIC4_9ACTN|nr:hypothetical protein [Nocardiopsis metallicus]MBB5495784.1 hypothetical protein [Nocardiopsis metallicus]